MYKCECGKEFKSSQGINGHRQFCKLYVKKEKLQSKYKLKENLYRCECAKEFNNHQSLNAHFTHCLIHRNGKPVIDKFAGKRGWRKGLTKETDERVKRDAEALRASYASGKNIPPFKGGHHTKEYREFLSIKQSSENYSGGRCKWYDYIKANGLLQRVQGTWELKFAKYLDTIDIDWIKPGAGKQIHTYFWIDDKGDKKRYTPDFWCPNLKKYYEIKGYWREYDKIKMKKVLEQNILNIEIIEKEQMKNLNLL